MKKRISKNNRLALCVISILLIASLLSACGKKENPQEEPDPGILLGFSQIGSESAWRVGNTNDIMKKAEEYKISLMFEDAKQKQENQIKAIKSFIEQDVDVIGLAPVVETGWDQVFAEAQDAGIPIILLDRTADVDESLYATFIGSDFIEEGKEAAKQMAELIGGKGKIVELEGTVGASAATDRKTGFDEEIAANYPEIADYITLGK